MDFYSNKNLWKGLLLIFAILIGAGTLIYTETFLAELRKEEQKKMEMWAQSIRTVANAEIGEDLSLANTVMQSNTTIPIILVDEDGNISSTRNIPEKHNHSEETLRAYLNKLIESTEPIEIKIGQLKSNKVYYDSSILLRQLRIYPRVLLGVIATFLLIAYITFSSSRRAEQDRVWTGLAKETAHQIGTPLSSLMGWVEILRMKDVDESIIVEIEKDIERLTRITDRFSKIGSIPQLTQANVSNTVEEVITYLQPRVPKKIDLKLVVSRKFKTLDVPLNIPLFQWVVENLIRNGIDSIQGKGEVKVLLGEQPAYVFIEIMDTGKGIPLSKQKAIFRPGFTTKTRGWGLGLSLSRRIINDYHGGKIFVSQSEIGKGTVFRIQLRKKLRRKKMQKQSKLKTPV
ncbi:MAG: HAMP domain-containing histidine kinase [Cryomorphaceae bacterium]|nr:HAMP domain-containing histidine kinase [Cryomorphaceae bacterium]